MSRVISQLESSSLIAVARFGRDGTMLDANSLFRRMIGEPKGAVALPDLVTAGLRDDMLQLLHGAELPAERRNLHVVGGPDEPASLTACWLRDGDDLVLIGELPIDATTASQAVLVRLNARVSELARENVKKSAQLRRALDDLRQAQTMLVHREKMAALGQMTAGVAHELNNPLSYVKNNLYLLTQGVDALLGLLNLLGENLDQLEASQPKLFEAIMGMIEEIDLPRLGEQIPRMLESIDDGLDRATRLVTGLRAFSRLDESAIKTIDLNESLRSVVGFVGFLLSETDTQLDVKFGVLPDITCYPGSLNQAVLNILTNAVQAAAPNGHVELTTKAESDEVLITISDDGPGVADDVAPRIFDPFFTTRPVGAGTGLGLSIAHSVVAAHEGRITLSRPPGGGATFAIHLPLKPGDLP